MAGKYKPYPAYKTSGVEWLGAIPTGWGAKKLGSLFDERREKVSDKDFAALSVTMNGIVPQLDSAAKTLDVDNRKLVKKGDFVINSRSDRKGSAGLSELDGSVSLISNVLIPREIDGQFIHHLLRSYPFQEEYYRFGKGIVADLWSTNFASMKNITLPVPTKLEQIQIAAFLDRETAKIDELIAKQQRLIELLEEKRQAVISHAVTRGLNPNVLMRPSGIDWLGDIPTHWGTPKLFNVSTRIGDGLHSTPIYQDGTSYYFINGNNLNDGQILTGENTKEVPKSEFNKHFIKLDKRSVLMSINGTIGKLAIYNDENIILGKSAAYINCAENLEPRFLLHFLSCDQSKKYYDLEITGTTIFNLSLNSIRQMKSCVPPLNEQREIVNFCDNQKVKFDLLLTKVQSAISLLKERRTALISATVTGKIDIRDWQPQQPNSTQQFEAMETIRA